MDSFGANIMHVMCRRRRLAWISHFFTTFGDSLCDVLLYVERSNGSRKREVSKRKGGQTAF